MLASTKHVVEAELVGELGQRGHHLARPVKDLQCACVTGYSCLEARQVSWYSWVPLGGLQCQHEKLEWHAQCPSEGRQQSRARSRWQLEQQGSGWAMAAAMVMVMAWQQRVGLLSLLPSDYWRGWPVHR